MTDLPPATPTDRNRKLAVGAVVVAVIAAAVVLLWPREPDPQPVPPHAPARVELVEKKNVALGLLENQERYAETDALLEEIAAATPGDPLGPQNLAINRLLTVPPTDAAERATLRTRLDAALDMLQERVGDTGVVRLLRARAAARFGDMAGAADQLRQAVDEDTDDLAVLAEYVRQKTEQRGLRDSGIDEGLRRAIDRAVAIAPENVVLRTQYQLPYLAAVGDPALPDAIAETKEALGPLMTLRPTTQSVEPLLDEAAAAFRAGDAAAARGKINFVRNTLNRQDLAVADRRDLHPHVLDFVVLRFADEVAGEATAADRPEPAVVATPLELAGVSGGRQFVLHDLNRNGRPELLVLGADALRIFTDSGPAADSAPAGWTPAEEIPNDSGATGLVVADLDLDLGGGVPPGGGTADLPPVAREATPEIVLFGPGGVRVFAADVPRELPDAAAGAGAVKLKYEPAETEGLADFAGVTALAAVDFDQEGDLDLVVAGDQGVSLLANLGGLKFVSIDERSQRPPADLTVSAIAFCDLDRDVDLDLLLAGSRGGKPALGIMEGLRHGTFRWRPWDEAIDGDVRLPAGDDIVSLAVLDVDGNFSWDVAATTADQTLLYLTRTTPDSNVLLAHTLTAPGGTGVRAADLDDDGADDLLRGAADGVGIDFARRWDGPPTDVTLATAAGPTGLAVVGTPAVWDADGDGDLDVMLLTSEGVVAVRNDGPTGGSLDIRLQAQVNVDGAVGSGRINAAGIGSVVEVKTGTRVQSKLVTEPVTHFGLGDAAAAEVARVIWTNGIPQNVLRPQAGESIYEVQSLKGSCPYLYAWDGEGFAFVTDCLWGAPIGLQHAEGVFAQPRAWEYLPIPPGTLVAKDGQYVLQLTEELWEAAYYDQVRLLAIDHPAGVSVFSNEKVGPASVAEFRVHTARQLRPPVAASDQDGRDLLATVADLDGDFTPATAARHRQGLLADHFLQLDLGTVDPDNVKLVLTGWMKPTDTSLNVQIGQDDSLPAGRPLGVQAPGADGVWRTVTPFTGFPGGKTKTIVIDLSGTFPAADHRVRLVSNFDMHWDRVRVVTGEEPAETAVTPLALLSADLHRRGFSAVVPPVGHGPDRFDYGRVRTDAKWPPMRGRFTRYGDVTDLLRETDDRQAVFGAGDEMTVRFAVGAPVRAGWVRDFFVHSVGYDKDADVHTVHGQSSGPLPFAAMSGYPWPPEETSPVDAEYLRDWQTRTQDWTRFWHWRDAP